MRNKKFEYKYVEQEGEHYYEHPPETFQMNDSQLIDLHRAINALGEKGWELVSVVPCTVGTQGTYKLVAYLKREL